MPAPPTTWMVSAAFLASSTDYNLFTGLSLISVPDLETTTIAKYLPTQNAPNQWVILDDGG